MNRTEICNAALGCLNHPALSGMDDIRPEADLCRRLLPAAMERLLGARPWGFATREERLAKLSGDSGNPEYPARYALPPDCVRVVELMGGAPYLRRGRYILTQNDGTSAPVLTYVSRDFDTDDWPPVLAFALIHMLAAELALPLANDLQLHQLLLRRAQEEENRAASDEDIENLHAAQPQRNATPWQLDRRG